MDAHSGPLVAAENGRAKNLPGILMPSFRNSDCTTVVFYLTQKTGSFGPGFFRAP